MEQNEIHTHTEDSHENNIRTSLAILRLTCANQEKEISEIRRTMVNKDQFLPVKLIVYGIVATALTAVLTGLLALILNSSSIHKSSEAVIPETKIAPISLVKK